MPSHPRPYGRAAFFASCTQPPESASSVQDLPDELCKPTHRLNDVHGQGGAGCGCTLSDSYIYIYVIARAPQGSSFVPGAPANLASAMPGPSHTPVITTFPHLPLQLKT